MLYRNLLLILLCMLLLTSCAQAGNNHEPDDYGGRKAVHLSALSYEYGLMQYVEAFNAQSDEYVVVVKSYVNLDEQESGLISYDNERAKFNAELMAGHIPDIVLCDVLMPVQSYINHGLFTDLYALMEADPDFDKADYLPNAFAAAEQDGKLFEIFPAFCVQTLYAKASDVGSMQGWTLDEFSELISSRGNVRYPIGGYDKYSFVATMAPRLFVDNAASSASFDRAEFLKLLEVAQRFPAEVPQVDDLAMHNMEMSGGDPLLGIGFVYSPRDIRVWEQVYACEEITLIGFPCAGGAYFFPDITFAITQQADEKDGAWEFVKFVLSSGLSSNIPVKLSLIDKMMEEAKKNINGSEHALQVIVGYDKADGSSSVSIAVDENGIVSEGRGMPLMMEIPVGNNTDGDNAKFLEFIRTVGNVWRFDAAIANIVGEEIGAYFEGQRTADQAADIIESRVNLYLSERG